MQSAEACLAARLVPHPDPVGHVMTTHPEQASAAEQFLKENLRWIPGCHGQAIEKMAKDFKARMTVRLAVAGAFHTHFMKPAEEKLRSTDPSNHIDDLHLCEIC